MTSKNKARIRFEPTDLGFQWSFHAMGTRWDIHAARISEREAEELARATVRWCIGFEQRYSRFIPDSWLSQINAKAGTGEWTPITDSDEQVLGAAREAHFLSKGLVDATALPLIQLWDHRRENPTPPTSDEIEQCLKLVNWNYIEMEERRIRLPITGMGLDFGGFGKELAVDRLAGILIEAGCPAALVNGGGDVIAYGMPSLGASWKVGLECPEQTGECWGGVELLNHALATSGGYQRYFTYQDNRYSHLIDPRSGQTAACEISAASIISPTCFQAGVIASTACMLAEAEAVSLLETLPLTEGCFHTEHGKVFSNGFSANTAVRQMAAMV
jgi:thiamine biosynthesis lipoprotein